jgi:UDP-N-acetylglucosamine/UDP-N-acetylgalactosamine diphosphorylase
MDGKIMLDSTSSIATAPDGNGGLYTALRQPLSSSSNDTVLSILASRKIEYLHAYGVDNCLVRVGDPIFLGINIEQAQKDPSHQAGVKTVRKVDAKESVGVVALKDGKWNVIEYSEIPESLSQATDSSGQLLFRSANIVNHFYTTRFLANDVPSFEARMAFHIARKKIPTINMDNGQLEKPSTPNGMKLELFIFDVFPFVKDLMVHEVERSSDFSPLKNASGTGVDDPQTSKRDLLKMHRSWLEKAGAKVAESSEVEISPLVSYAGEGLESLQGKSFEHSTNIESL